MKKLLAIITLLATLVAAASGLTSCGNEADFTVGIAQLAPHPALDAASKGFKDALTEELQKAGKTVEFKEQNAGGEISTCPSIVGAFVASGVDLILANATPVLQAAKNATKTIPIMGTSVTEYGVALGIENFDGTVGTNVSGTSDLAPLEEQAQMLIDTLSLTKGDRVGLLFCSAEPNSEYQVRVVKTTLTAKGIECTEYPFADSNELTSVATKAANDGLDAIYVPTDNTAADNAAVIKNATLAKGVPVFAGEEGICKGCGYATLSIDYYSLGRKTGEMAAKVLLGEAHIEDMAIGYDANPTKKYNKEICDALGIDTAALEAAGYVAIED
ncbi:MAG: ABC transporter substrate-binding protein [Clostridia bacterium]|nr:ABC transporter substrate-binding protein [Clostridia bacterium]